MRRLISMTLLALIVLLGFQFFTKPKPATPAPAAPNQAQTQTQAQTAQPAASPAQPAQPRKAPAPVKASVVDTPAITASAVAATTVENANLKIVFTNKGAQVEHWILEDR